MQGPFGNRHYYLVPLAGYAVVTLHLYKPGDSLADHCPVLAQSYVAYAHYGEQHEGKGFT